MKLGSDVLLEIMAIVQRGLLDGGDVSQSLRDLELAVEMLPGEKPYIILKKEKRAD